jgi:PAS domain S-box-containing protein
MEQTTPSRPPIKWAAIFQSTYARVAIGMVLILVGYLFLYSYFGVSSTDRLYDLRRQELKRLTYVGVNLLQPVLDQQRRGELTEAQAIDVARDLIGRMKYLYGFWAGNLFMGRPTGEMLVRSSDAEKAGPNQPDLTDANGDSIMVRVVQAATSPASEGYIEYPAVPPGSDRPQLKIAFVVGIPEWKVFIGTGMFVGDIDAQSETFARNSLLLTAGLFIVVFFAVFFVLRPVFSSYRTLLGAFDQIIHNPDATPHVPVEQYPTGSEARQLMAGFRDMLRQIQQSKRELQTSEERFNLAVQGTNDGIWDWQIKTNTAYYSPRWKSMLGYEDHELPNRFEEWSQRIHPDDLDRVMKTLNDHLEGHTPYYEVEHRVQHKDESYRWILARGASVRDENGRPSRMAGSHTDITERRRVNEELIEREAQYRRIFEVTTDGLIITRLDGAIVEANPAACAMFGYTHDEFMSLDPRVLIHPDYRTAFEEYLADVGSGKPIQIRSVDVRRDGTLLDVEMRGTLVTYRGESHILSIVQNVTERVRAYQLLEQRVQERTHELATLLEITHNMTSTLELKPLLRLILNQLKEVVDYSGATIFTLNEGELTILDYQGPIPADEAMRLRFPLAQTGANAEVIRRRQAVIIGDVRGDSPLAREFQLAAGEKLNTTYSYIRSWLGVPLTVQERLIGMMSVDHDEPYHYTSRDAQLALAIATQAAIAIANSQLYWQAKELAALEERQRLARELHDSVSQALYGIALGARTARAQLERDPSKVAEPLDYVLQNAEAGLAEMRALIFELRPESLKTDGLAAALTKQAEAVRKRHHIEVATDLCEEREQVPLEVKEALYRIAQEGMHNVVKHAHATRIDLKLQCDQAQTFVLEIDDDGVGFDSEAAFPGHLGLRSMRERVMRLGGVFSVASQPGQGTHIRVQIPFTS